LDALLVERLKLEEIGLKHIGTFEKLTKFYKGFHDFLLSKNPYIRKKTGYDAYRYQVRMYILGLLRNFTCEHCNKIDLKRSLHFHHVNPETKRFRVSRIGQHNFVSSLNVSMCFSPISSNFRRSTKRASKFIVVSSSRNRLFRFRSNKFFGIPLLTFNLKFIMDVSYKLIVISRL